MRILEGWTKEERTELESAKSGTYESAIDVIYAIIDDHADVYYIRAKYYNNDDVETDNRLAKDIVDFYQGTAKFPDKKYILDMSVPGARGYVEHISQSQDVEHVHTLLKFTFTDRKSDAAILTEKQIKNIDPRYMAFAVPVEGTING